MICLPCACSWSSDLTLLSSALCLLMIQGSYYANPLDDDPARGDATLMQQHPAYFRPNIWPSQDLPGLEQAFKELGKLIMEVGLLLTTHCDK